MEILKRIKPNNMLQCRERWLFQNNRKLDFLPCSMGNTWFWRPSICQGKLCISIELYCIIIMFFFYFNRVQFNLVFASKNLLASISGFQLSRFAQRTLLLLKNQLTDNLFRKSKSEYFFLLKAFKKKINGWIMLFLPECLFTLNGLFFNWMTFLSQNIRMNFMSPMQYKNL